MALSITDDTFTAPRSAQSKGSLRRIFGKVAAVIALGATIAFYGLGFNISKAYYDQWQENKAQTTATQSWNQTQPKDYTKDLPWAPAGGALALSFAAGATGIALGKKKQSAGSGYYGGSSYSSSDDGFWWGYFMGSSNSSSSSSSSDDNGGAALVLVAGAAVGLAAASSVVTYKALKANFGSDEPKSNLTTLQL